MKILMSLLLLPGLVFANDLAKITMKDVSEHNQPIIEKAIKQIFKACPGFNKYWGDVESARVEVWKGNNWDYRRKEFGWKNYLMLRIKVKNNTKFIPNQYRVFGHTLQYDVGGGNHSSILTKKTQGQYFCGGYKIKDDGGDAHLYSPAFVMLDKLK